MSATVIAPSSRYPDNNGRSNTSRHRSPSDPFNDPRPTTDRKQFSIRPQPPMATTTTHPQIPRDVAALEAIRDTVTVSRDPNLRKFNRSHTTASVCFLSSFALSLNRFPVRLQLAHGQLSPHDNVLTPKILSLKLLLLSSAQKPRGVGPRRDRSTQMSSTGLISPA